MGWSKLRSQYCLYHLIHCPEAAKGHPWLWQRPLKVSFMFVLPESKDTQWYPHVIQFDIFPSTQRVRRWFTWPSMVRIVHKNCHLLEMEEDLTVCASLEHPGLLSLLSRTYLQTWRSTLYNYCMPGLSMLLLLQCVLSSGVPTWTGAQISELQYRLIFRIVCNLMAIKTVQTSFFLHTAKPWEGDVFNGSPLYVLTVLVHSWYEQVEPNLWCASHSSTQRCRGKINYKADLLKAFFEFIVHIIWHIICQCTWSVCWTRCLSKYQNVIVFTLSQLYRWPSWKIFGVTLGMTCALHNTDGLLHLYWNLAVRHSTCLKTQIHLASLVLRASVRHSCFPG